MSQRPDGEQPLESAPADEVFADHGERHLDDLGRPDEEGHHPHENPDVDPEASDVPTTARRRRPVPLRKELPLLAWLIVVWLALSRDVRPLSLLFGLVLVWVIAHVFRLPPVELAGRFRPLRALAMLARITWLSLKASLRVFMLAVTQGPRVKSSILRVDLVTHDDLIITAVSHALAIVPGSIVCEVYRDESVLYVHVLGVSTDAEAEEFIAEAHETEYRILDIMGREDEVRLARARAEEREAAVCADHADHATPKGSAV